MKPFLSLATALLIGFAAAPAMADPADPPLPGYDRLEVRAAHRANLIPASVWYPAGARTYPVPIGDNALFQGARAFMGAAVAKGKFPLILLSHGSGGNMDGLAWLSSGLVARGAIVLAVNHPGSTSGDSSPRRSMYLGSRAADLSAALDQLLANPDFAPHVETGRISALGFSLGGTTTLALAGLRFDPGGLAGLCDQPERIGVGCAFYRAGGVDMAHLPADFGADASDARISRAVAIEPGFTEALTEDSIAATDKPVLLLSLGDASTQWTLTDTGPNGTRLDERLAHGARAVVSPGHHFTALPVCKPGGAEMLAEDGDDPICDDPEGTDRAEAHRQMIRLIADFLDL